MKKKILLIIALVTFSFSYSQEWKFLYSDEGSQYHIRLHSKETAWIKETPNPDFIDIKINLMKTLTLYKFDCRKKKLGKLAETTYNTEGDVIDSEQINEIIVDMNYALPESFGEFFLNSFCDMQ